MKRGIISVAIISVIILVLIGITASCDNGNGNTITVDSYITEIDEPIKDVMRSVPEDIKRLKIEYLMPEDIESTYDIVHSGFSQEEMKRYGLDLESIDYTCFPMPFEMEEVDQSAGINIQPAVLSVSHFPGHWQQKSQQLR